MTGQAIMREGKWFGWIGGLPIKLRIVWSCLRSCASFTILYRVDGLDRGGDTICNLLLGLIGSATGGETVNPPVLYVYGRLDF